MSNGQEFLISIRTAREDQGIKLTDEQFAELGKTAGRANEKIHEGHETLKLDHRELRESVGAVGRAFGGLADVGLWLSPVTAALAAVLFLVDKLKEYFSELNKKIREYIDTSREIRSDHLAWNDASEGIWRTDRPLPEPMPFKCHIDAFTAWHDALEAQTEETRAAQMRQTLCALGEVLAKIAKRQTPPTATPES